MNRIDTSSLWLPVLSGVLLLLTLPYVGFWPFVWIALVPLFLFATNKDISRSRLALGTLIFGIIYAIGVIYPLTRVTGWWWTSSTPDPAEFARQIKFVFFVLLAGCWGALYFLPLTFFIRSWGKRMWGPLAVALVWVLVEWLRSSFALFGYSWGAVGYTLLDTAYLKHIAAIPLPVGGVYALSFLVVFANAVLADLIRVGIHLPAMVGRHKIISALHACIDGGRRHLSFWIFLVCFVSAIWCGIWAEYSPRSLPHPVRVAVLSSELTTQDIVGEGGYRKFRQQLLVALESGALVVVLPENAFPFFEINEESSTLYKNSYVQFAGRDELYADFLAITRTYPSAEVIVGLHTVASGARYNSLVQYQNGIIQTYYHKRKLVPFVEYSPLWFRIPIFERLTRGEKEQFFSVAGLRASALMCSEVGDATILTRGAELIISPSNDSVFVGRASALMHHQMARMRALEAGAYMLRSAKGGISSIIGPDGNVITKTEGVSGVLTADLR